MGNTGTQDITQGLDGAVALTGIGSPEGVVTADAATLYYATDLDLLYVKTNSSNEFGWMRVIRENLVSDTNRIRLANSNGGYILFDPYAIDSDRPSIYVLNGDEDDYISISVNDSDEPIINIVRDVGAILSTIMTTDSNRRFLIDSSGTISFGDGVDVVDTSITREEAGVLRIDGALRVTTLDSGELSQPFTNIQNLRETASSWAVSNPTLLVGQIGIESDTGKFKMGDGSTAWNSLSYVITKSVVYSTEQTLNTQTDSYELVLSDAGKLIEMNKGTANDLTVPSNASVAFPIGTRIDVAQYGDGQTTVVATGGVTIRSTPGLKLRTKYSGATLVKRATDEWYLFGDLSA